jgi:beta-galactosidase
MDDISDPNYVREAGILADRITKPYAHHPAVIAVGYDNEIGNGFMSYSEADRADLSSGSKRSMEQSMN